MTGCISYKIPTEENHFLLDLLEAVDFLREYKVNIDLSRLQLGLVFPIQFTLLVYISSKMPLFGYQRVSVCLKAILSPATLVKYRNKML